jgi:uncharacterized protein with NAD-binding domain and iron-sulfur cluster
MAAKKRKITILGGGIGGLTTALKLTEDPTRRAALDVTVRSLGWRLGGKCASGRDLSDPNGARIYEHGLHIFAGFYHYGFDVLKSCYDELQGEGGVVAANVYDAFRQNNNVVIMEHVDGKQVPWPITFLETEGLPGQGAPVPSDAEIFRKLVDAVLHHFLHGDGVHPAVPARASIRSIDRLPEDLRAAVHAARARLDPATHDRYLHDGEPESRDGEIDTDKATALHHAAVVAHANALSGDGGGSLLGHVHKLLEHAEGDFEGLFHLAEPNWLRRLLHGLNLGRAVIAGYLGEDVANKGYNRLDDMELKVWLMKWGATEATVNWGPVAAGYDYTFAYGHGDPNIPALGAGTALRCFLRLIFAYKGSLFWEMKGAMGEVVILPMYLTLLRRGVRFQFFQQVLDLGLSADGDTIDTIEIAQQAKTVRGPYEPLKDHGDLKVWPAEPDWSQLVDGAEMKEAGVNFESAWLQPRDPERMTLRRGEDFDDVVVAIAPTALGAISSQLSDRSPDRWRAMVEGLATTRTLALQLWTKPDLSELGWPYPDHVLTRAEQPLSSWSDMSFLIESEGWQPMDRPGSIIYFCGQMKDPATPPDPHDPHVPAEEHAEVRRLAYTWLKDNAALLAPHFLSSGSPIGIPFDALFTENGSKGEKRFDAQYWRANVSPWERYVQAAPGTVGLRLRAEESGYSNLWLAGDWTLNGINAGCVEAATMSGIECARAMMGDYSPIPGETT